MRWLAALALASSALLVAVTALLAPGSQTQVVVTTTADSADPVAPVERAAAEPRGRQVVVRAPAPTETPVAPIIWTPEPGPEPAAPITAAAPAVSPAPQPCAANFFCYPRLGISGAIVPYDDCSGTTEVGQAIRQPLCVREGIWLAGHAYTQFGRITGFRAGDIVFVHGRRFEITGSAVQRSCAPSTQAVAPLSLQTSLESATCGRVLVVQGR